MRAFEFLTEATVGREFNHLEDLVFTNPDDGAKRAVQIIKDMGSYKGDYPGVASLHEIDFYRSNCPDPNLLLKLNL